MKKYADDLTVSSVKVGYIYDMQNADKQKA